MFNEQATELGRKYFNLACAGHRHNRIQAHEQPLKQLEQVLEAVAQRSVPQQLRVLTGLSDGTDAKAAAWAFKHDHVELVAAFDSPDPDEGFCEQSGMNLQQVQAHTLCLVKATSTDAEGALERNPLHIQISDDFKLGMADALVVVWDGEPARGPSGGTVRILAEALRRRMWVLWIDLEGNMRVASPLDEGNHHLARVAMIEPLLPKTLTGFFMPPMQNVAVVVEKLAADFAKMQEMANEAHKSLHIELHDPGKKTTQVGRWHKLFFGLLGGKDKHATKVVAWRGPKVSCQAAKLDEESYWQVFDRYDRAASQAANRFRDAVVVSHLLASLAVFAAVAGSIAFLGAPDMVWAGVELVALLFIGWVVYKSHEKGRQHVRDVWLRTRQAAEFLRINALLLPFMAFTPNLQQGLWLRRESADNKIGIQYAHWLALQRLHDAELPRGEAMDGTPRYLLSGQCIKLHASLRALLEDQREYHAKLHEKSETMSHRLHNATRWVYFAVLFVVVVHVAKLGVKAIWYGEPHWLMDVAHWLTEQKWLLLITAFFPAMAAGLHGILTTLELRRSASNSKQVADAFNAMVVSLGEEPRVQQGSTIEDYAIELRAKALVSASLMYAEHSRWSELMTAQDIDIPA